MCPKNVPNEDEIAIAAAKAELLEKTKELIQILDSSTRFNLLQALFVYRKLNLSQLSKFLEVSKSTVLHHLKKFEDLNLVTFTEVKAKHGSLPTKIYHFNVAIFDMITQQFDYFINIQNYENFDDFLFTLKAKQLFFAMIAQLFEKTVEFYSKYEEKIKKSPDVPAEDRIDLIKKNHIWFNIDYLTQTRKEKMMTEAQQGKISIRVPDQVETSEEMSEIHPYLAFHVVLPIPAILGLNLEKKKKQAR